MKSMASPGIEGLAIFIVVADEDIMLRAAKGVYRGKMEVHRVKGPGDEIIPAEDVLNIVDPGPLLKANEPGIPSDEGARKALHCLAAAVDLMRGSNDKTPRAIVTAPLNKERIARVHPGFIGHTEYLQEAYSSPFVTMVLIGQKLCVIPVTRHIPLRDVPSKLSEDLIFRTLSQVIENRDMISGKKDAIIGVAALNPHCGEGGRIGTEEIEMISPAVKRAKALYGRVEGPVSADVIFYKALEKKVDIVVAMYHDQCLSPFKMVDFDRGVNMTLGLGHVRTSPDHGTAFDIAGKGIAAPGSMEQAIRLAVRAVSL